MYENHRRYNHHYSIVWKRKVWIVDRKEIFQRKETRFRLEYDACRAEIALLPASAQTNEKLYELEKYKEKYEQLKSDTSIKLQLLDENQVWFDWDENIQTTYFVL